MADSTTQSYTLTDEHKAQFAPWKKKWQDNASSTKPMDTEDTSVTRKAIVGMYQAANMAPPRANRIVFVASPFIARFAAGFAAWIWYLRDKGRAAECDQAIATIRANIPTLTGMAKSILEATLKVVDVQDRDHLLPEDDAVIGRV
jgi:hypothetical protein